MELNERPNLGLATTEELFDELIARFEMVRFMSVSPEQHILAVRRGLKLAEILDTLNTKTRNYRPVDVSSF